MVARTRRSTARPAPGRGVRTPGTGSPAPDGRRVCPRAFVARSVNHPRRDPDGHRRGRVPFAESTHSPRGVSCGSIGDEGTVPAAVTRRLCWRNRARSVTSASETRFPLVRRRPGQAAPAGPGSSGPSPAGYRHPLEHRQGGSQGKTTNGGEVPQWTWEVRSSRVPCGPTRYTVTVNRESPAAGEAATSEPSAPDTGPPSTTEEATSQTTTDVGDPRGRAYPTTRTAQGGHRHPGRTSRSSRHPAAGHQGPGQAAGGEPGRGRPAVVRPRPGHDAPTDARMHGRRPAGTTARNTGVGDDARLRLAPWAWFTLEARGVGREWSVGAVG